MEKKDKIKDEIISWIKAILIALVAAWLVNNLLIINARVPSGSMENTIMTGDRLFANRLAYTFREPERFDIAVFEAPDEEGVLFVKRVIGLPGDTVEIITGNVYINDELLEEAYLRETPYGSFGPYTVPEEHYFMLGDNRNNSEDARMWDNTYVHKDAIIGKVVVRYFPSIKIYRNDYN